MLLPAVMWLVVYLAQADLVGDGLKALDAKDYPAAVALFTKAVAADPKDYGAHFNLALAYSLMERKDEAITEYQQVLQLKPGLYEAELNLGILLTGAGRCPDALPHLQGAVEKKPAEFRPRIYFAQCLLATKDWPKAEAEFREAARLDAKRPEPQLGLGQALARQGRLEEAEAPLREAVRLDPSYKDGLLELASRNEEAGRRDAAIALFQEFTDNAAAQEHLGQLLIEAGRPGEAIPYLEAVVKRDPTPANQLALATAYRRDGKTEKAIPLVAKAVAAEPGNLELHMIYGSMLRDQKQYGPAAQAFFAATKIKPDHAQAWSELAGMLILLENYGPAIAALDRVKALGAEKPGHLYFRAITLDKLQQYKPALESYEQFLAQAGGKFPDEEFKARQRVRIIKKELSRR